ncbi:MAG: hypothetical protein ACI9KE_005574 [Polyangiales bacterium]|jgi:hypothetical protein
MASEGADVCWVVEGGNIRFGWNLDGHGDGTTDSHNRLTEAVWLAQARCSSSRS